MKYRYEFPEKVVIRPLKLDPFDMNKRIVKCKSELAKMKNNVLLLYYKDIAMGMAKQSAYHGILDLATDFFVFADDAAFEKWFSQFPPLTQKVIWGIVFYEDIPKYALDSLLPGASSELSVHPVFIEQYYIEKQLFYTLKPFLREMLFLRFVPPPGSAIENCAVSVSEDDVWSAGEAPIDAWKLFCAELRVLEKQREHDKLLRGLQKRTIEDIRCASGFPSFPEMPKKSTLGIPNAIDLAARFTLCMSQFNLEKSRAVDEKLIKKFVDQFFEHKWAASNSSASRWNSSYEKNYFEYYGLLDHFNRKAGVYFYHSNETPSARLAFKETLLGAARKGGFFSADKLALRILTTGQPFGICIDKISTYLKLRSPRVTIDGVSYENESYYNELSVTGFVRHDLFTVPLFKAYCWVFAALGILDITVKKTLPGNFAVDKNGKQIQISPFDSLEAISVTEFGKWCIGHTTMMPRRSPQDYIAIADKELFLVTMAGKSLERKLFLDKIGERLGENGEAEGKNETRWRISAASFLNGCGGADGLEECIQRFHTLIERQPAPHWEEFFKRLQRNSCALDSGTDDAIIFQLPASNRALAAEILEDEALRKIAFRAEGGRLVVPIVNLKKFKTFLASHGVISTIEWHSGFSLRR